MPIQFLACTEILFKMGIITFLRLPLFKVGCITDPRKYSFPHFSNKHCKLLYGKHCDETTKQVRPSLYLDVVYQGSTSDAQM